MTEVADDDELLRRIHNRADFLVWHADLGRWIPSLAGLRFDPDGMSVFLQRLLQQHGASAVDVSTLGGTNAEELVYGVAAAFARHAGFHVAASANSDTPIGYAHASVVKPAGMAKPEFRAARTDLAEVMDCVHGEPDPGDPPAS